MGLARTSTSDDPQGTFLVRVRIAPNRIVSVRTQLDDWYGPVWNGVGRLDGRRGGEIVMGKTMGAHTAFYRVLTWREGALVTLNAPGRDRFWSVDAAYTVSVGWAHRPSERDGLIRRLVAERNIETTRWQGTITSYQWSRDGWRRLRIRTLRHVPEKTAYSWAGFHVRGLKSGLG